MASRSARSAAVWPGPAGSPLPAVALHHSSAPSRSGRRGLATALSGAAATAAVPRRLGAGAGGGATGRRSSGPPGPRERAGSGVRGLSGQRRASGDAGLAQPQQLGEDQVSRPAAPRTASSCSRARGCCPATRSRRARHISTAAAGARPAGRRASAYLAEEELDQRGDLLAPLAQRRHVQLDHLQAVVEILAERARPASSPRGRDWSRR